MQAAPTTKTTESPKPHDLRLTYFEYLRGIIMIDTKISTEHSDEKCSFERDSFDPIANAGRMKYSNCVCLPQPCAKLCHSSTGLASKKEFSGFTHPNHRSSVIAYVRVGGKHLCREEQEKVIDSYCALHEFKLAHVFSDVGKPSYGLQGALQELKNHDALVAVDLDSFVEHEEDRIRDLRPFIHHFFCNPGKHLITIQEGVDTGTAAGQTIALDISSQVKESF
jgi:hypothetical protein